MLESLGSGGSVLLLVGEELGDEVLAVVGDVVPDLIVKAETTGADLLHDLLVRLPVEGWHTGKEDVGDDSAGPDIALGVVVLVQNLWGDVVGCTEFLVEVFVGVVDEGGTEIDDLDGIEFLVLLEQNVLGLEISVHNVVLMAVIDAREDLLHKHSAVSLGELASLQDLVEELSSFADFGDEIVAFLVLEELVHLNDVGVVLNKIDGFSIFYVIRILSDSYNYILNQDLETPERPRKDDSQALGPLGDLTYDFFQNVDLVEKHALLILVHVTLTEHLDGSLCR